MDDLIEIFEREKTCNYRGENYRVRDNGAILRLRNPEKRKRPLDEKWTFGKPNKQKGYLNFGSEAAHRIVATAFLGKQPTEKHVVDHIDTNKKNNRQENLRWVTRLENILLNPITLSRIIFKYGSIDSFLANPSKPNDGYLEQNFDWMRTVTKEESDNTRRNLLKWAKEGKVPTGGQLGEWIFEQDISKTEKEEDEIQVINYILSKTPNAAQELIFYNDKPNEFPCTPEVISSDPLNSYYTSLKKGKVFFRNHNGEYVIVNSGYSRNRKSILILTRANYIYQEQKNGDFNPIPISEIQEEINTLELPHSLSEVTYKDNLFIHSRIETGFHPREELEEIYNELVDEK